MKNIMIKHSSSGLNSKHLILNAISKRMELGRQDSIVFVSHEVHLEDVVEWVTKESGYKVESGVLVRPSFYLGDTEHYLQLYIESV